MRSGPLTVSWLPLGYRYINQVTVMFIRGPIIGGLSHIPHRVFFPPGLTFRLYVIGILLNKKEKKHILLSAIYCSGCKAILNSIFAEGYR